MLRKKPVYIVKNAHALSSVHQQTVQSTVGELSNGYIGNYCIHPHSVTLLSNYSFFSSFLPPLFLTKKT